MPLTVPHGSTSPGQVPGAPRGSLGGSGGRLSSLCWPRFLGLQLQDGMPTWWRFSPAASEWGRWAGQGRGNNVPPWEERLFPTNGLRTIFPGEPLKPA